MDQGHREVSCCCGFAPLAVGFKKNTITNRHHADNQALNIYMQGIEQTPPPPHLPEIRIPRRQETHRSSSLCDFCWLFVGSSPPPQQLHGEGKKKCTQKKRDDEERNPHAPFPSFFHSHISARAAQRKSLLSEEGGGRVLENMNRSYVCTKEKRAREVGGKGEKALGWRKRNRAAGDV